MLNSDIRSVASQAVSLEENAADEAETGTAPQSGLRADAAFAAAAGCVVFRPPAQGSCPIRDHPRLLIRAHIDEVCPGLEAVVLTRGVAIVFPIAAAARAARRVVEGAVRDLADVDDRTLALGRKAVRACAPPRPRWRTRRVARAGDARVPQAVLIVRDCCDRAPILAQRQHDSLPVAVVPARVRKGRVVACVLQAVVPPVRDANLRLAGLHLIIGGGAAIERALLDAGCFLTKGCVEDERIFGLHVLVELRRHRVALAGAI